MEKEQQEKEQQEKEIANIFERIENERKIAIEKLKALKLPKWEEDAIMKTIKSPFFGWM